MNALIQHKNFWIGVGISLVLLLAVTAAGVVVNPAPVEAAPLPQTTCTCTGGDTLNCSDFDTQEGAQSCFDQCLAEEEFDVHDLDGDNDGLACEGNPSGLQGEQTIATPTPTPEPPTCDCRGDTLDCNDFPNQDEAQRCFNVCRSIGGVDVYGLDLNGDGVACQVPDDLPAGQIPPASEPVIIPEEGDAVAESAQPQEPVAGANNMVFNGNFEFGFYQVPALGFEARDVGNVPVDWDWYKSNTYGKVTIENNQEFGLVCADDVGAQQVLDRPFNDDSPFGPVPGVVYVKPNNSLSFHMQSTDQQDMRLGVYQVIDVTPGQYYRLTMSGTIQTQSGATTLQPNEPPAPQEAPNHTVEISFDHRGGTNWRAIPLEERHIVEFEEQKLEFKVSEDDDDIADIEDYETVVRARGEQMTLFITAWRKWSNWRTSRTIIDCVSLVPIPPPPGAPTQPLGSQPSVTVYSGNVPPAPPPVGTPTPDPNLVILSRDGRTPSTPLPTRTPVLPPTSTPDPNTITVTRDDEASVAPADGYLPQPASFATGGGAAPAAAAVVDTTPPSMAEMARAWLIPATGGILEKAGSPLIILASVVVLLGLVGAGLWNTRRR